MVSATSLDFGDGLTYCHGIALANDDEIQQPTLSFEMNVEFEIVRHVQEALEGLRVVVVEYGHYHVCDTEAWLRIRRVVCVHALDVNEVRMTDWSIGGELGACR